MKNLKTIKVLPENEMTLVQLKHLIQQGEGYKVEFREARNAFPKKLLRTVAAFNNTSGGDIILGVTAKGEVVGVTEDKISQILSDLKQATTDQEQLKPPLYLSPKVFDLNGKKLIWIRVDEGFQVRYCDGWIWGRSYRGNLKLSNPEAILALFDKMHSRNFEYKTFPSLTREDLDESLISRVKAMALRRSPNHPWGRLSNDEFLLETNLVQQDLETKQELITLAAVLLFGKDSTIQAVLPHYQNEAIFKPNQGNFGGEREMIRTNLLDSFELLFKFGQKHLKDHQVLEGVQSVSTRDMILREIISNSLVHRDFSSGFPAKILISHNEILLENGNVIGSLRKDKLLNLNGHDPWGKNFVIGKIFREIGLIEEIGVGVRLTNKYNQLYSGYSPVFTEDWVFRTKIPLNPIRLQKLVPELTRLQNGQVKGIF